VVAQARWVDLVAALRPALSVSVALLRLDKSAIDRAVERPQWTRLSVAFMLAGGVCFGVGMGFVSPLSYVMRPLFFFMVLAVLHVMLRSMSKNPGFPTLVRCFGLVVVGDVVGLIPTLGTLTALVATFWYLVILLAICERIYDLSDKIVLRKLVVATGVAFGCVVALGAVDAALWGRARSPQGPERPRVEEPTGQVAPVTGSALV
jgi:hypothetical protein